MRHFRQKTAIDQAQAQASDQLTPEQMAAVIRQSSVQSVKNHLESVGIQLSAAQQYAISQGLDADKIVIAWEGEGKRGVSASNLRIDQREQLREVVEGIKAGKIKVVWAYTHSRLFRDPFGVQSGTFMEICAKHHIKVVIDKRVYDFNDDNDRFIFGIEVAVAAKENKERVKWMVEAKHRKAERGQYHGRVLVPGFIIDRDKLLPDGKLNPNYGKFKPYEPHAKVTRAIYARYRALNRQFNVLAREVEDGKFLYPDFEPWVDPRDINQFRLTKVPGGYVMGREALRNLLTAVEVVGYWKVAEEVEVVEFARTKDTPSGAKGTTYTRRVYYYTLLRNEDGTPKKTHDGIVPMDDFLFAFNHESQYTLDGEENTSRYNARATWKPVKKDRQEPLLVGLLTSPNGSAIQYAKNTFRVMEKRRKYSSRPSVTLTVNADLVVRLFLCRLQERYIEHGREVYEQAQAELARVRANNATALVSVDEQIANYQKSIKNNEDGLAELIATFGRNFNKGTAARINEDINREQAILNDLIAKKNAAQVEESQLQELCDNIVQVIEGRCDCDVTQRFIKLATDKIELAECSAHFATLTVYWSAPFAQVDVCYIWLPNGVHENWEDEELARLRELYPYADRLELLQAFPVRSWSSLMSVASDRGIKRYTNKNSSDLPTRLALRDQEIIDLLGFYPGNGYEDKNLWVNDVSTGWSVSTRMFSPAQPSIKC